MAFKGCRGMKKNRAGLKLYSISGRVYKKKTGKSPLV
jgi:hypothetical protein